MKNIFSILVIYLLTIFFVLKAYSQAEEIVEVEYQTSAMMSYQERRTAHGGIFGFSTQKYNPIDYQSVIDGLFIDEFFNGSKIDLMQLEFGYKYNFGLGSVGASFVYGQGEGSEFFGGLKRTLSVRKMEGMATFYADNLTSEAYLVPYAAVGIHQLSIDEKKENSDSKGISSLAPTYKIGLQISLSPLDKNTARDAYTDIGLENTFFDIYLARYESIVGDVAENTMDVNDTGKPDTATPYELGFGLKMEF